MSEDGSAEASEFSDSDNRANRWKGPYSTWHRYTEQERGLAASLDQIRNTDLSIHLYNAHALKKRAREVEENSETARVHREHPFIPEEDRTFKPPKYWTAWPLPPEEVPREGEVVGVVDSLDSYTFKNEQIPWPSRQLEDVLAGVMLRLAKERFQTRDSESVHEEELAGNIQDSNAFAGSEERVGQIEDLLDPVPKEEQPEMPKGLKPIVAIDDERSMGLMRPSIRHTLSKLDDLLSALHHARETTRRYSQSDACTTDDEALNSRHAERPDAPEKRPKGRPRKFADLPDRSRGRGKVPLGDDPASFRAKKTHRGRPLKAYERLEGETEQEYVIRIARQQKKPLPSFAPPKPIEVSPAQTKSAKSNSPAKRTTTEELKVSRQKKLGGRDWSEVLGAAALVGFPPGVIARASQRCTNLFEEGMVMRTMVEMPFTEKEADTEARYVPERVPDFRSDASQETSGDELAPSVSSSDHESIRQRRKAKISVRSIVQRATNFCPMTGCLRKIQGFRDLSSLKRHLLKFHDVPKDEVDEYILPSDEEMDGAVHVDGFLKPLKRSRTHGRRNTGIETKGKELAGNSVRSGQDLETTSGVEESSEAKESSSSNESSSSSNSNEME